MLLLRLYTIQSLNLLHWISLEERDFILHLLTALWANMENLQITPSWNEPDILVLSRPLVLLLLFYILCLAPPVSWGKLFQLSLAVHEHIDTKQMSAVSSDEICKGLCSLY